MTLEVPVGMMGAIVDRYVWGPHKYIIVKFSNGVEMTFGDATHPLISYRGFVESFIGR